MDTTTHTEPHAAAFPADCPRALFITGTDTDAGKSFATGWMAREIAAAGQSVITQKLIQTGNHDLSEDIDVHRRIMGIPLQPRDLDHTTAPIILSYPASPDLAARLDGVEPDFEVAARSTAVLLKEFDNVLLEGAGGLMVPLREDYLTIDYAADHELPAAVITNGKLGSINHTLLTLSALRERGMKVYAVVYNPYFDRDATIAADTRAYLRAYLAKHFAGTHFIEMPAGIA